MYGVKSGAIADVSVVSYPVVREMLQMNDEGMGWKGKGCSIPTPNTRAPIAPTDPLTPCARREQTGQSFGADVVWEEVHVHVQVQVRHDAVPLHPHRALWCWGCGCEGLGLGFGLSVGMWVYGRDGRKGTVVFLDPDIESICARLRREGGG